MHSSAQGYADRSFSRVVDSIEGAVNLRDFGGYPTEDGRRVRTGVLYRSGDTHGLSAEGHSHLAVQLGIRTVIDLRNAEERAEGLSAFEAHGIATVHEPLRSSDGASSPIPRDQVMRSVALGTFDWAEVYWSMLHLNADRFRRILELIAQPDALPVLIHCAGGRDRTGVTAALVLFALGVPGEHRRGFRAVIPAPRARRAASGVSSVCSAPSPIFRAKTLSGLWPRALKRWRRYSPA